MSNFFVNLECGVRWIRSGPRAARKGDIRTMELLRKVRGPAGSPLKDLARWLTAQRAMRWPLHRRVMPNAGWHFTYLGGVEAIHEKVRSFAGHERVPSDVEDSRQLAARIANARPISFSEAGLTYRDLDETFPAYLLANQERFGHLIADAATYRAAA